VEKGNFLDSLLHFLTQEPPSVTMYLELNSRRGRQSEKSDKRATNWHYLELTCRRGRREAGGMEEGDLLDDPLHLLSLEPPRVTDWN
jgi:hypothetical protein